VSFVGSQVFLRGVLLVEREDVPGLIGLHVGWQLDLILVFMRTVHIGHLGQVLDAKAWLSVDRQILNCV